MNGLLILNQLDIAQAHLTYAIDNLELIDSECQNRLFELVECIENIKNVLNDKFNT